MRRIPHRKNVRQFVSQRRLRLEPLEDRRLLAVLSVTNTNDSGVGSMRQALIDSNASADRDTIVFNIGAGGVQSIQPASALPTPFFPLDIDGTTQPGFSGTPLIELNGSSAGNASGLVLPGNSSVRGLVINRFVNNSFNAGIFLNGENNVVVGNFIGTDVTGTIDLGNANGIRAGGVAIGKNRIGGPSVLDRNVISGNHVGIELFRTRENIIQGNYLGPDASGTLLVGTNPGVAINVEGPANLIGGMAAGEGNVIVGTVGVLINTTLTTTPADGNTIQGNLIGTNAAGTAALGGSQGIRIATNGNLVGGADSSARNVVSTGTSATSGNGITVSGSGNLLQGNFVGTDVTGTIALGNRSNGIEISTAASSNNHVVGNVVSGSGSRGITVNGTGHVIQGNYVGTDRTGTLPLGNLLGVELGGSDVLLGGSNPASANVISGNLDAGVFYQSGGFNRVQGNLIGTAADAVTPLGNGGDGVRISFSSAGVLIGGTSPGEGNVIAFNARRGVLVSNGVGNTIRGNAIYSNSLLGIDLNPIGVTANDAGDADTGINHRQNFPIVASVTTMIGETVIAASLNSIPSETFEIDFFSSPAKDASSFGEGKVFLGSTIVTTDSSGNATFIENFSPPVTPGHFITATATNSAGSTSEFSLAVEVVSLVNQDPIANADSANVYEDGSPIVINLTANDTDPDLGDDLQITSVDTGAIGFVTINPDGDSITYDPNGQFESLPAGETDTETFSYTISDGNGGTSTALVSVTVTGQNDAPETEANSAFVSISEGQTATNAGFFFDIDEGDDVTLTASKGTVSKTGQGTWEWSYFAADNESATILITAEDGHGGIAVAAFGLQVLNESPTNLVIANQVLAPLGDNVLLTADVSFDDPGADIWTAIVNYGDGTIEVLENVGKTFSLHHEYGQAVVGRLTVTIADDDGGILDSRQKKAMAFGTKAADKIALTKGSVIVELDGVEIAHLEDIDEVLVWGGDGDDEITLDPTFDIPAELQGGPGNDTLVAGAGPTVLSGGSGDDELVGGSGPVTVVGGTGSNVFTPGTGPSTSGSTNPEAFADSYTVAEDGQLLVAAAGVLANDVLGSASVSLTVSAVNGLATNVGQPVTTQHGLVTLHADGSFTYMPGIGCEATSDSFSYTLTDASGATSAATATISIVKSVADGTTTIDAGGIVRMGGTAAGDLIVLTVWNGKLYRNLDNTGISASSITEIRVWGRSGSDIITDLTGLDVKRFIHGGDGNDLLTGGELNDVIFGGNGDDILAGLAGHDLLVGGEGRDRIVGSSGHDILIAGEVDCALSLEDLREVSHAWASTRTIAADAVDEFLEEAAENDGEADQLTGSSGADLFIIHSGDKITDFKFGKPQANKDGDVVLKNGVVAT